MSEGEILAIKSISQQTNVLSKNHEIWRKLKKKVLGVTPSGLPPETKFKLLVSSNQRHLKMSLIKNSNYNCVLGAGVSQMENSGN